MANKSYTLMELEAIKKLCKSVNLIANLPTDLIADTNVATNTTYSSYRIDAEMSVLENDIQRYVDTALAGLSRLTKEVIDDKALVVKENVLYLYKDPSDMNNDYMQMMLINGVAVELGSTTCDFSSVYSKDEIDDKFALKIDLDVLTTSFNNLVTTVDKKIDKDKIVTVLDGTVTDEQVPSAKVVYEELDKVFTSVSNGKNLIASAITDKGVNTSDTDTFETMANNIEKISVGSMDGYEETMEYVIHPKMTSNVLPYGEVSASNIASTSNPVYFAFDEGVSNYWQTATGQITNQWIQYKADRPHIANKMMFKNQIASQAIKNFRIEGSNDGVDYDILYTGQQPLPTTTGAEYTVEFNNDKEYLIYRLFIEDIHSTTGQIRIMELKFYGTRVIKKALKPLVPPMTSNTTPEGEVTCSSLAQSSFPAWKVFSGTISAENDIWATADNASTKQWIQYNFDRPQCAKILAITNRVCSTNVYTPKEFVLEASDDGSSYDELLYTRHGDKPGKTYDYVIDNNKSYLYYRITFGQNYGGQMRVQLALIQLYG